MIRMLENLTHRLPVLIVVEDVHWIDPSTLDVLSRLIQHTSRLRLLLCCTFRPEFRIPWNVVTDLHQLVLDRLTPDQADLLVQHLTSGRDLPIHVRQSLLAKADGVPLFIEELAKACMASGGWQAHTLHAWLLARLDQMGASKTVAQLAATLGLFFSWTLLQSVSCLKSDELQRALQRLTEAELIEPKKNTVNASYTFKHALIQEILYQSIPSETRRQYHEQIARALVQHVPLTGEIPPELVAHHLTEAGLLSEAIPYWHQAGTRANARSACAEAVNHLNKGLALQAMLPDSQMSILQELDLQTALAPALMATTSPTAPEVERVHARARELCQQVGTTPKLIWPLEGLWAYYHVRGQLSTAQQLGEQLLHLAHRLQSPIAFAVAHQTMGLTLFYLGQFDDALAHLEKGSAHYVLKPPRLRHLRGVHDQGVMCHAFTALASCLLGYPDQALLRVDTMIELAEEALHPFSLAFARCAAAVLHQCRQEAEATQQHAEIAIELSAQEGFPLWHAMGTVLKGWALTRQSQVHEGIIHMQNGLNGWRLTGAVNVTPYFLALLADAYREAGQVHDGLTALGDARQVIQETGERWWEAEIYRLTGEMLLMQSADHADQAEHLFHQAIEVAHELGAKLCELRAAISLSQLLDRKGQTATAIDQLRDIYDWFTDGFHTLELQAARRQLDLLQNHLHTASLNLS